MMFSLKEELGAEGVAASWKEKAVELCDDHCTQHGNQENHAPFKYRLTSSRSHLTLAKDSGRTTAIEKESRMAVLFSTTTRSVMASRISFAFFTPPKCPFTAAFLSKSVFRGRKR